jgi:hypothetical protein
MIEALERSKESRAQIAAFTVGIIGTGFMAGAVFAYLAGMPPLMVLLAVPAFLGWALPYFCYRGVKERRANRVAPAIDEQYDTLYEVCEKGHALLVMGA